MSAFDTGDSVVVSLNGRSYTIPYAYDLVSAKGAAFNFLPDKHTPVEAINLAIDEIRTGRDWVRLEIHGKRAMRRGR